MQGNEKERKIMMANNVKSEHNDMKQDKQALGMTCGTFVATCGFARHKL